MLNFILYYLQVKTISSPYYNLLKLQLSKPLFVLLFSEYLFMFLFWPFWPTISYQQKMIMQWWLNTLRTPNDSPKQLDVYKPVISDTEHNLINYFYSKLCVKCSVLNFKLIFADITWHRFNSLEMYVQKSSSKYKGKLCNFWM